MYNNKSKSSLVKIRSSSPCPPNTLSARVLVELSADVVKMGQEMKMTKPARVPMCQRRRSPFGEPKSHVSSRSWTEEGEEL
ncbi:hypothetical protein TYRP_022927 [Tyrophagus putrescentiae]|nr:hypothetical protein TYRP_022927 [Tyrophagus putrescentiae]